MAEFGNELTDEQKDGLACFYCGRPLHEDEALASVPIGIGRHGQTFACWPSCEFRGRSGE